MDTKGNFDERSGKGGNSTVPKEIRGWNWGAAGLVWLWGVYHRVWLSLLNFLPLFSLAVWLYLGLKGNELAWRANKWESADQFNEAQKKWKPWGILSLGLALICIISFIVWLAIFWQRIPSSIQ